TQPLVIIKLKTFLASSILPCKQYPSINYWGQQFVESFLQQCHKPLKPSLLCKMHQPKYYKRQHLICNC
ncbi:hypothetical protein QQP08_017301, partial [Theobroma cacao]